jgi:hypothetical protein
MAKMKRHGLDGRWIGDKYLSPPVKERRKFYKARITESEIKYVVWLNNHCTYDIELIDTLDPNTLCNDMVHSYGELVDCEGQTCVDRYKRRKRRDDVKDIDIRPPLPKPKFKKGIEDGIIQATKDKSLAEVREERLRMHEAASATQKRWKTQRLAKRLLVRKIKQLVEENKIEEARAAYDSLKRLSI